MCVIAKSGSTTFPQSVQKSIRTRNGACRSHHRMPSRMECFLLSATHNEPRKSRSSRNSVALKILHLRCEFPLSVSWWFRRRGGRPIPRTTMTMQLVKAKLRNATSEFGPTKIFRILLERIEIFLQDADFLDEIPEVAGLIKPFPFCHLRTFLAELSAG